MDYNAENFYKDILTEICRIRGDDEKLRKNTYEPQIMRFIKSSYVIGDIESVTKTFPVEKISIISDDSLAITFNKEFIVITNGITMAPVFIDRGDAANDLALELDTSIHLQTMATFIVDGFSKTGSGSGKEVSAEIINNLLTIIINFKKPSKTQIDYPVEEKSDAS